MFVAQRLYSSRVVLQGSLILKVLATLFIIVFLNPSWANSEQISVASISSDALQQSVVIASKGTGQNKYPSITAVLKKFHERNPDITETNWIQMSPVGLRVRDVESKSEIIKNFSQQRVWLINSKNKTQHEIDISFYEANFPDQVRYLLGAESISNISGSQPCADLVGEQLGERYWRGQLVDEWSCRTDDGELYSTQFFSARWKLVVRVKHADLSVEELVDIQEESSNFNTFLPDENLEDVNFVEFITGRRQLDLYSP